MTVALPVPMWLGDAERPLFAWLHAPDGPVARGVILCPPLGYEGWCSYQTFRELAERLAAEGAAVLRIEYDGTGSSAGDCREPGRLAAWQRTVRTAIDELRGRGVLAITLVGLRFGASLALHATTLDDVDTVVMWEPVVSGRRYARELKVLAAATHAGADVPDDGLLGVAGTVYTSETLAEMGKLELASLAPKALRRALVLHRDDREPPTALATALGKQGIEVDVRPVGGIPALLEVDNEAAVVPRDTLTTIVGEVCAQMEGAPRVELAPVETKPSAKIHWQGGEVVETALRFGPEQLFGVLGLPANGPLPRKVVLMLNGGTEHQVGPGRVWVEFARALNVRGVATLRADVDGVGDSPTRNARTARSYDPEHVDDVVDFVAALRLRGFQKIVILGLCSGSWLAVQAGLRTRVEGIFALNAQLYWQQGDPVYLTFAEALQKQRPDREREAYWAERHLWSALDVLGVQHPATRWLGALLQKGVRTHLAYAEGDEGVVSLRTRNRRRLSKLLANRLLSLEEMMGIDHGMHRFRLRPHVLERLTSFVDGI